MLAKLQGTQQKWWDGNFASCNLWIWMRKLSVCVAYLLIPLPYCLFTTNVTKSRKFQCIDGILATFRPCCSTVHAMSSTKGHFDSIPHVSAFHFDVILTIKSRFRLQCATLNCIVPSQRTFFTYPLDPHQRLSDSLFGIDVFFKDAFFRHE